MISALAVPLRTMLFVAMLASTAPVLAQDASPEATPLAAPTAHIVLPGDMVFPEGIALHPETGEIFVGSFVDGTVFRGDLDSPTADVFLEGGTDDRTSALGLRVNDRERLFVAGGATGLIFVYDTQSGVLLAKLAAAPDAGPDAPSLVNDVAVTPDGAAYVTDSFRPQIYRVTEDESSSFAVEEWLDLVDAGVQYAEGVNFNGIVATPDGRFLIAVQLNSGKLFRIDIAAKRVDEIALEGGDATNGDGLVLDGNTLWVVRNLDARIVEIRLSDDALSGRVVDVYSDPAFDFPTTAVLVQDTLLVVNSQFDRQGGPVAAADAAPPELPFEVLAVPVA